jgi:hypothetical protein
MNCMKKGRKERLFKIIAIRAPFFILFFIEMSCVLFQYGDNLNLLSEAKDRRIFWY